MDLKVHSVVILYMIFWLTLVGFALVKKLLPKKAIFILFLGFGLFVLIFWNSNTKEYYENSLNGIVENKIQSKSGILIKLYEVDDYIDLNIGSSNMSFIDKGDSISKPAKSEELYLFKKDTTIDFPKYFYIENVERFKKRN